MAEYKQTVNIINYIEKPLFKGGPKNTTIESHLKKRKPEYLDTFFFGVDVVHISIDNKIHNILIERKYNKLLYMQYKEIERKPVGILKDDLTYKHEGIEITVSAEHDPIKDDDPRVNEAYEKIKKFEEK